MAFYTNNAYGRISISEEAVAQVAGYAALECYGIVDLVASGFTDSLAGLFGRDGYSRGVKVMTGGNKIFVDLSVSAKYGVSLKAVADSLKNTVRYAVEKFTGMMTGDVKVNIMGVRL